MAEPVDRRHVVIVGGGLAGCTAALALARQPDAAARYQISLIECKSRLGGRVGSYTDQTSGLTVDYCQHVGMNCCSALKQLIKWLDQQQLWRVERDLYFYGPGPQRQQLTALPYLPAPLHLSSWLWKWPGLKWLDRLQIARGMLAINRVDLASQFRSKLEPISALEWLRAHGQSDRVLDRFWSTILVSALGEQLDRVGLVPMVKVFQDGFLRVRDAYHLLIPERPLDELFGRRMHEALGKLSVAVHLNSSVGLVDWQGARCCNLSLSDGTVLQPDELIIAVPWHAAGEVVKHCQDVGVQGVAAQAAQLEASPITGVHTWWDRAWLPTPHAVLVGQLCQWVFPHSEKNETSAILAGRSPMLETSAGEHYYQIVVSASRMLPRGDSKRVAQMIEEDLREVFPEARDAKLLRVRSVTDPQAVFSVAPGTGNKRPRAGTGHGNICWAGDWTDTGWPATMEGAIRSGLAAAASIDSRTRSNAQRDLAN